MGQKQFEQMLADFQSTFEGFYDPDNDDIVGKVMNYAYVKQNRGKEILWHLIQALRPATL